MNISDEFRFVLRTALATSIVFVLAVAILAVTVDATTAALVGQALGPLGIGVMAVALVIRRKLVARSDRRRVSPLEYEIYSTNRDPE